jgi:uncharacterized membrane protein YvlD (DUF360 family)
MLHFVLVTVLCVLVMYAVVPALTRGAVAVPSGGLFRALAAIVVISIMNWLLWFVISLTSLAGAILSNIVIFGAASLLVTALALWLTSRMAPSVLYVRSFGAALGGAFVTTACAWVIYMLLG